MTYYYSLYDFIVQSELQLPAPPLPSSANSVSISYGSVSPEGLANPVCRGFAYQASHTDFWLNIPSVARFLVSNGQSIVIDPIKGVDEDSIQAFLLSTCMEVLLRQRQLTVLPGYALKMGDCGIAFLGNTGLGQSMLQGLWYKQGYSFLTGNVVVFNSQGEMLPGTTQLDCLPTVISSLKLEKQVLKPLRPNLKKSVIPLGQQYHASPLHPQIIYTLKMHDRAEVLFTELDYNSKLSYLQQLMSSNILPVELWSTQPKADLISIVCIQLPMTELKLQPLAEAIKQDVMKRGHSYA